jgi:hypothetical protein
MERMLEECADRIVDLLAEKGEVNLLHLCELLSERSVVAYQALGWLAREGRIAYAERSSQVFLSLRTGPKDSHPRPSKPR